MTVITRHYVAIKTPLPLKNEQDGLSNEVLIERILERFNGISLDNYNYRFDNQYDASRFEDDLINWDFETED